MSMSNKIREMLVNLFMVEDAAGLDYIETMLLNVQRKLFFMLNVRRAFKSVSNRMNSWYSRN